VVGRLVLVATPADEDQIDLPTPLWLATLPVLGPIFYTLGRFVRPVRKLWMQPFVADPGSLSDEVVEDAGRSTPAAVGKTLGVARREISRGRLARQARIIKTPVLLIAGEEDQIVDPQSVGAWARSADQAEVCLLDECGHLPMIERTAEFNAQILAFLTGDNRYLDYVEAASETAQEELYAVDDGAPREEEPEDVPSSSTHLAGTSEETREPAADSGTGRSYEPPNIVRKQGDRYPARNRKSERGITDLSLDDGADDDSRRARSRERREPLDEDVIPELPQDLFDWPDAPDEFLPRERPRTGPSENREGGSGDQESPPRFQ